MSLASSELKELYHNQELYYAGSRPEMLRYLPKTTKKVLDVGCGQGNFAADVKKITTGESWGIDLNSEAIEKAKLILDQAFAGSISELYEKLPDQHFDAIYFNDILEHLVNPYQTLEIIKKKLSPQGVVIASIPNVRYFRNLRGLLWHRDWKYEDEGILDRTHLRFFTKKSIERMFDEQGYEIISIEGINKTKSLKPYFYNLFTLGMFGFDTRFLQFAVVARPR